MNNILRTHFALFDVFCRYTKHVRHHHDHLLMQVLGYVS